MNEIRKSSELPRIEGTLTHENAQPLIDAMRGQWVEIEPETLAARESNRPDRSDLRPLHYQAGVAYVEGGKLLWQYQAIVHPRAGRGGSQAQAFWETAVSMRPVPEGSEGYVLGDYEGALPVKHFARDGGRSAAQAYAEQILGRWRQGDRQTPGAIWARAVARGYIAASTAQGWAYSEAQWRMMANVEAKAGYFFRLDEGQTGGVGLFGPVIKRLDAERTVTNNWSLTKVPVFADFGEDAHAEDADRSSDLAAGALT